MFDLTPCEREQVELTSGKQKGPKWLIAVTTLVLREAEVVVMCVLNH